MSSFKIQTFTIAFILLSLILPGSFAQELSRNYLPGARVTDLKAFGNDIWVSTYGQGIYRYSKSENRWYNFSTKNENAPEDFFYCIEVNKDFIWAGSSDGLYILDRKKEQWRKRKFAMGGEFGNWIRTLRLDSVQNKLWIGRFRNITVFDLTKPGYTDIERIQGKDQKSNTFQSIGLDGDSLIWFGTESGVHIFNKKKKISDPSAWRYLDNNENNFNGLGESVSVSCFLFEGKNIWFGTDEFITEENPDFNIGGIFIFDRLFNWHWISVYNGLGGNGIYCLERTGNVIWAGVYSFNKSDEKEYGKGLYLIDRLTAEITPLNLNEINSGSSSILSLLFDGQDMWIGTSDGLVRIGITNSLASWNLVKKSSSSSKRN
ncbi:MAG: hypothetical protein Kow0098_00350 [Ignavibacteriaceae bacterium]